MASPGTGSKLVQVAKNLPAQVKKGVVAVAKMLPRQKEQDPALQGFSSATNMAYPNSRMIPGLDQTVDVPVKTLLKETPPLVWEHAKMYAKEHMATVSKALTLERPEVTIAHLRGLQHGETNITYDFSTDEKLKLWKTGCDSDWKEGYSRCKFERTDRGTALFSGTLSGRLPMDGRIQRAGWCAIKSDERRAFLRRVRMYDWQYFSHLIIKLRGDGRSYKVLLHVQEFIDMQWGDNYSYPLHTHGGPYWQYEKIPFPRFFKTCGGRIQDRQQAMPRFRINAIGITLMDRIDGDFRLELGFVGAVNDITHAEKFAYEQYQLPVYTTVGI